MSRPIRVTPERLLAAAAHEFAAHGFAGARVDRIAARAKANKAMVYYHFGGKRDMYRTMLRQLFDRLSASLEEIGRNNETPTEQLRQAIAVFARFIETETYFPAVMLREIAEGGAHLDAKTLTSLGAVPAAIATIITRGIAAGEFRPVHPLAAYLSIVAPLPVFMATAPIRSVLGRRKNAPVPTLSGEEFVTHVQDVAARMLRVGTGQ